MYLRAILCSFICVVVLADKEYDIFPSLPIIIDQTESNLCGLDSHEYMTSLKNFSLWAYDMLDSSARSPNGILHGSIYNMGNFRQCLQAKAPFPTQYCLVSVTANIPKTKTPRDPISNIYGDNEHVLNKLYDYRDITRQSRSTVKLGWCIPASCPPKILEKHLNKYISNWDNPFQEDNVTFTADIPDIFCQSSNHPKQLDLVDYSFCIFVAVLAFLIIIATYWEYNHEYEISTKRSWFSRILFSFSAKLNFVDLLKNDHSDEALSILHGIKLFAICAIILGHKYGIDIVSASSNFEDIEVFYRNTWSFFAYRGDLFVDTFFLISGILATYGLLAAYEKKFRNPVFIIFLRYMRLTPPYAFMVFFTSTVFYHTGSGPIWEAVGHSERNDCRQNWWSNLLYIANYYDLNHMCMVHTWYICCDFFYFIIALVLIVIMSKNKKLGLASMVLMMIISILIPFVIILVYERPPLLRFLLDFLTSPKFHPDMLYTYTQAHTRAGPYFVGMAAGYIYYKLKDKSINLSKLLSFILFAISIFILFATMGLGSLFYDPYYSYTSIESAAYGAINRPLWALGTFGLMFATSYGTLGFLRKLLSYKCWVPLGKLVYGAYLWHFLFEMRALGSISHSQVFTFCNTITKGLSDICWSFIFSLGLYLFIEAPSKKIFKELLMPARTKDNNVPEVVIRPEENSKL